MSNIQAQNEGIMLQENPGNTNLRKPEDIKPSVETRGGDLESTPFVKDKGLPSAYDHSSRPVTLTFKDLTYSVQVKNPKKSVNDEKCES